MMAYFSKAGNYHRPEFAASQIGVTPKRLRDRIREGSVEAVFCEGIWLIHEGEIARLKAIHDEHFTALDERRQAKAGGGECR